MTNRDVYQRCEEALWVVHDDFYATAKRLEANRDMAGASRFFHYALGVKAAMRAADQAIEDTLDVIDSLDA